jgi:hypothetical protein
MKNIRIKHNKVVKTIKSHVFLKHRRPPVPKMVIIAKICLVLRRRGILTCTDSDTKRASPTQYRHTVVALCEWKKQQIDD